MGVPCSSRVLRGRRSARLEAMVVAKEAAVVVAEAARVAEAPQEASEATVVATEAAGGADHRTASGWLWMVEGRRNSISEPTSFTSKLEKELSLLVFAF